MNVIDSLSYDVIDPQDERYESARVVWNGSIDHRPVAIARPRTDAEVVAALVHARDKGVDIAVRGGGHSRLSADITDVRRASDLADYDGELEVRATVRLTDRLNGSGLTESTTLSDVSFEFTVPCTVTEGTGTGSECSITTTADAVAPGIIDEGARAVFQLGQVTVADGGPDGLAATEPNGVFAVQGIFVP